MEKLAISEAAYVGLVHLTTQLRFFRLLKGLQFERLLSRMELHRYARGETIFHKGQPPLAFYIVYQGRVRIHLGYRFWGLFRRVAYLGPGEVLGERALLEKRVHSATATAWMPSQIFVFSYEQFDELMRDDPDFAELIRFVFSHRH
jgi:CRP-like cAMP-binding protein